MSGVFGIVDRRRHTEVGPLLSRMGQSMSHRPWFQVDTHYSEADGVGLGRIGNGILEKGSQPAVSEDAQTCLLMDGDLFYTENIRKSLEEKGLRLHDDGNAALALRLYEHSGEAFVTQLEGIFCIVVWDRRRSRLVLANDRFGLKNLYYIHAQDKFLFSPEIKGILVDQRIHRNLNMVAVSEYMRFQQLLGDKTFLEDIHLLSPATICILDLETHEFAQSNYWDWRSIVPLPNEIDSQEVGCESERLLRRAVKARLKGAERPGIFLSGGMDSRCLVALAKDSTRPITTITYGHPESRDVVIASRVARVAGSQHHYFEYSDVSWVLNVVDHHLELVEGAHSWMHAHGLHILPQVRQLVDVNLSGFGGTVLGGMFSKQRLVTSPDWEAFYIAMAHFYSQEHTWPGLTEAEARYLFAEPYAKSLPGLALDSLRYELKRYKHPNYVLSSLFFNIHNHDRRMINNFILFGDAYVQNRCPFYDYRFVDFAASIPPKMKSKKQVHGLILKRTVPRLTLIPYEKYNRLPSRNRLLWNLHALYTRIFHAINSRMGIGKPMLTLHTDYERSLRNELRNWAESILFDERTLSRGIFRPEAIRSLMDRHLSGREEWTIGKIAPIMTLEMMMRKFLDEPASSVPATELE